MAKHAQQQNAPTSETAASADASAPVPGSEWKVVARLDWTPILQGGSTDSQVIHTAAGAVTVQLPRVLHFRGLDGRPIPGVSDRVMLAVQTHLRKRWGMARTAPGRTEAERLLQPERDRMRDNIRRLREADPPPSSISEMVRRLQDGFRISTTRKTVAKRIKEIDAEG